MQSDPQLFATFDPKAVEVISAALDGSLPPAAAAAKIKQHWFPSEALRRADGAIFPFATRGDSLSRLDQAVSELSGKGQSQEARRLAEMNWLLAQEFGDFELKVQCAATLSQTLMGEPGQKERRLELLEFAAPEVLKWDRLPLVKAVMLYHLAEARLSASAGSPDLRQGALVASEQALKMDVKLPGTMSGHLHFIAGTILNEAPTTPDRLEDSIRHFEAALAYYTRDAFPETHGSILNNLGNSYRDLGELTKNRPLLEQAIRCYDEALPCRKDLHLHERTLGNKARACDILGKLEEPEPIAQVPANSRQAARNRVRDLVRSGTDALWESLRDSEKRDEHRKAAGVLFLKAMRATGMDAEPALRAEVLHALAALFLQSINDDEMWMAFCFASAAHRLSADCWRPVSRARLSCHRGWMLTVIGFPGDTKYLTVGERLLRESIGLLEKEGHPGEAEQAHSWLQMSTSLLAACGDDEARQRGIDGFASTESQRLEAESVETKTSQPEDAYSHYLRIVSRVAAPQLEQFLGSLALAAATLNVDQHLDEFNCARELIGMAKKHRDVGDLSGAIAAIERAKDYAVRARYSAPSIWCKLTEFYLSIPMIEPAKRCVEQANIVLHLAVGASEAVLPGNMDRRWIPEYSLADYEQEIEDAGKMLASAKATPKFEPRITADLLADGNESNARGIRQMIEFELKKM